jgi:HEAT repeat protein
MRSVLVLIVLLAFGCSKPVSPALPPAAQSFAPAKRFRPVTLAVEPMYKGRPLSAWAKQVHDHDSEVHWNAINALVDIGEPSLPYLAETIRDKDLRGSTRAALQRIGEPSVPLLLDLLGDADVVVRHEAACALSWMSANNRGAASLSQADWEAVKAVLVDVSKNHPSLHESGTAWALEHVPAS